MAGLLDGNYTPDPLSMGLLALGSSLMTPRAMGGGIGPGMQAFAQQAMAAQQMRRQMEQDAERTRMLRERADMDRERFGLDKDLLGLKRGELDWKRQQDDASRTARGEFEAAYSQAGGKWSPQLSMMALRAGIKGEDLERLAKGGNLGREKLTWQNGVGLEPFTGAPQAVVPDANAPFNFQITNGALQSVPNAPVQNFQMSRARAGATNVNTPVQILQEREESKVVGAGMGKAFLDIQNAGMQARSKVNNLTRLESLLSGYETGKLTPLGKEIASYAASLGINVGKNLGNKEAAEALSNELALQARNPSGGAGMPGAMSDQDRAFLQNIVPNLAKSTAGNRTIIETQRRLAKREMDVARMASEYRGRRGSLDPQFYQEMQQWSDANPLFADMPSVPVTSSDGRTVTGTISAPGASGWSIKRVP
jgi:hypothetical protein